MGGWIAAPGHSFYLPEHIQARADYDSKFALEGFTESVAKEIGHIAEPNGMETKFVSLPWRPPTGIRFTANPMVR